VVIMLVDTEKGVAIFISWNDHKPRQPILDKHLVSPAFDGHSVLSLCRVFLNTLDEEDEQNDRG